LREGLEETLSVQPLGITGAPYPTLRTTNSIETSKARSPTARNVKRWRDGQMTLRWVASEPQRCQESLPQARSRHSAPFNSEQDIAGFELGSLPEHKGEPPLALRVTLCRLALFASFA
jgi:hypothetical protein